jgi:RNA polymerase sigma-70 factor (ECF subfamily)
MEGPADHELMARAAKGDGQAFRILAGRHAERALRLARRILGNEAMAEDVVQDAFLRVWINASRWRPEAAFRTWLYRIVVNLCLNARRRASAFLSSSKRRQEAAARG